jgi:pentatricopeptide repeat protein
MELSFPIFTNMIDGFCKAKRFSEAKDMFLEIPRFGVAPTVHVLQRVVLQGAGAQGARGPTRAGAPGDRAQEEGTQGECMSCLVVCYRWCYPCC